MASSSSSSAQAPAAAAGSSSHHIDIDIEDNSPAGISAKQGMDEDTPAAQTPQDDSDLAPSFTETGSGAADSHAIVVDDNGEDESMEPEVVGGREERVSALDLGASV